MLILFLAAVFLAPRHVDIFRDWIEGAFACCFCCFLKRIPKLVFSYFFPPTKPKSILLTDGQSLADEVELERALSFSGHDLSIWKVLLPCQHERVVYLPAISNKKERKKEPCQSERLTGYMAIQRYLQDSAFI